MRPNINKSIVRLLLLLMAAGSATFAVAEVGTGTFTINAPLDGYVFDPPTEGSESDGRQITPAEFKFDSIGYRVAGKPENYVASFGSNITELSKNALPSGPGPLVVVRSEALRLQLLQSQVRVEADQTRLQLVLAKRELESNLHPKELQRIQSSSLHDIRRLDWERRRFKVAVNGKKRSIEGLSGKIEMPKDKNGLATLKLGTDAEQLKGTLDSERRAFLMDVELAKITAAAQRDVEAGQVSVEIAQANMLIGEIYCPQKCKVTKVFVFAGQYVTRGDPLLTVQFTGQP